MDSILSSVKLKLGIHENFEYFDDGNLIGYINAAFLRVNQHGVGPDTPFKIEDDSAEWSDFSEDPVVEYVKPFIATQVKLQFDPPSNSFLVENMKEEIRKYEWLMNVEAEKTKLYPADMTGIFIEE